MTLLPLDISAEANQLYQSPPLDILAEANRVNYNSHHRMDDKKSPFI